MKKLVYLFYTIIIIFSLACGQKEPVKEKSDVQILMDKNKHDVDSIEKRYNRIKKLVDAGYTDEQAEQFEDSVSNKYK